MIEGCFLEVKVLKQLEIIAQKTPRRRIHGGSYHDPF